MKFIKNDIAFGWYNKHAGIYKEGDLYIIQLRSFLSRRFTKTVYKSAKKPKFKNLFVLSVLSIVRDIGIFAKAMLSIPSILVYLVMSFVSYSSGVIARLVIFEKGVVKEVFNDISQLKRNFRNIL